MIVGPVHSNPVFQFRSSIVPQFNNSSLNTSNLKPETRHLTTRLVHRSLFFTHHSTLDPRHFFLFHPHKLHVEALLLYRLKINPPKLVLLAIIGQCVGAAGVIRCAQFDEDI